MSDEPTAEPPAAVEMIPFRVKGPKGTFDVRAVSEDAARDWYRNETALDTETAKALAVTRLE